MSKKTEFPSVLVVSGSQELLRRRFIANVKATQEKAGWTTEDVDGEDAGAVRDVLDGGGLFSTNRVLAVVYNPQKVSLDLLARHQESKDFVTTLLLHIEGEPDGRTKFGKMVKKLGSVHKGFPKPKEWDEPGLAAQFMVDEAKLHGRTMDKALAGAFVSRVGTDLGVCAFEVEKAAMLATLDGSVEITGKHIKGAMAPISEASVGPIMDALASRNRKKLSKALAKLAATSKDPDDQVIRICRFLGSAVNKWISAAYLDQMSPADAAAELGINPWYFEAKILGPAKRWGKAGTVRLASDLAAAERAVLNGAIRPWTVLTARLLGAC